MGGDKKEMLERKKRELKAIEMIDLHGPMSCVEIADLLKVKPVVCAATLKRLTSAGTHELVLTDRRHPGGNNKLNVYCRKGAKVFKYESPLRPVVKNMTDKAREVIRASGITERITSKWLAEQIDVKCSQSGAILKSLSDMQELEIQLKQNTTGFRTNFYRVLKLRNENPLADLIESENAFTRISEALTAWHPGATKRYELRGTA